MNKKGNGYILGSTWGYYIMYGIIFLFAVAIAARYINAQIITDVDFSSLEQDVVSFTAIGCFKGDDFGIIDYSRFGNDRLKECFDEDVYHVEANLESIDSDMDRTIRNFIFSNENKITYYVLIKNEDKLEKGFLTVVFEDVA